MIAHLDLTIPGRVRRKVAEAMPGWLASGVRVMLYPAGRLTRAVLDHGLLEDLPVLGLLDRDPALAGLVFGGLDVHTVKAGLAFGPDLILVFSTEYHQEIMKDLAVWPVPALDLCAGMRTVGELGELAVARGLRLESLEDEVRILWPGPPERSLILPPGQAVAYGLADFELLFRELEPLAGPGPMLDFREPFPRFRGTLGGRNMVFGNLYEACIFCRIQAGLRLAPPFREGAVAAPLAPSRSILRDDFLAGKAWRPDLTSTSVFAWNLR